MIRFKLMMSTVLASLMIVAGWTGTADAATGKERRAVSAYSVKRICETSGRYSALYRALCMRVGTPKDAVRMWYSVPVGVKGREAQENMDRRSMCKFSYLYDGVRYMVRETFHDEAYDLYHNHLTVLRWTSDVATAECRAMGYRV
jgi:hypothetical protein